MPPKANQCLRKKSIVLYYYILICPEEEIYRVQGYQYGIANGKRIG